VVLEKEGETVQASGADGATTNNRMELMAAIEGLLLLETSSMAQVFTTSDYLFQGVTRWRHGWRQRNWVKQGGQPVANADLWQALDQLLSRYAVRWVNAKGMANEHLQVAGSLATQAQQMA
jgi:ribonuclease HI